MMTELDETLPPSRARPRGWHRSHATEHILIPWLVCGIVLVLVVFSAILIGV